MTDQQKNRTDPYKDHARNMPATLAGSDLSVKEWMASASVLLNVASLVIEDHRRTIEFALGKDGPGWTAFAKVNAELLVANREAIVLRRTVVKMTQAIDAATEDNWPVVQTRLLSALNDLKKILEEKEWRDVNLKQSL